MCFLLKGEPATCRGLVLFFINDECLGIFICGLEKQLSKPAFQHHFFYLLEL